MKCLIVSDIDNTLFPFSQYAITHLDDDKFSDNPLLVYNSFDTPFRDEAFSYLQRRSAGNTRIQGMDLIAEIVAHLRYRLTIDCDIIFVTDRKHCSSGLTETWIRSSCFNIWPDPEVRIIGTEERIDMMYNAMDYDVILYLDDKPRAINNFAAYMPNNVMMLIPKFPYNDSEIQYCSDLKRDFHAMEHFLSCRYTKQSIDATLLAIEKFIKRIRYEARRSEDKGKTI